MITVRACFRERESERYSMHRKDIRQERGSKDRAEEKRQSTSQARERLKFNIRWTL